MLPPLPDNLAAQKAFSDALLSKNLAQSISVLVPGKPRRGSPGLGSPAAPAPPPLQAAAASPPPKPGRPACHCFLDLGGPIRGGFLNSNFWLPAFAQEAPSEGEGRLRRKLEGRQIRVAGVEAVAGLEGGDTYWDRWGACLRRSHSQDCFRRRRLRWAVFLYQLEENHKHSQSGTKCECQAWDSHPFWPTAVQV